MISIDRTAHGRFETLIMILDSEECHHSWVGALHWHCHNRRGIFVRSCETTIECVAPVSGNGDIQLLFLIMVTVRENGDHM